MIKDRLVKLDPPPIRDIPILIGGGGEKVTLRIVAEQADIWHWFGSTETFAQKTKVLDKWCEKVGRDPADVDRSIGVSAGSVHLGDEYVALGAHEIPIGISGPDLALSPVAKWLACSAG